MTTPTTLDSTPNHDLYPFMPDDVLAKHDQASMATQENHDLSAETLVPQLAQLSPEELQKSHTAIMKLMAAGSRQHKNSIAA